MSDPQQLHPSWWSGSITLPMRYRRYSSGSRPETSVSQSSPPVHPTTWRRRYQNLQPLAHGGMARVYRAYDTQLERQIALKVLPRQFSADPVMIERFRLETLRMQALRHPHIVPILDYGLYRDRFFFSMPFYPTTLQQQLRQYGTPPLSVTTRLVEQLAAALDCAHSQGIIHRDIKPSNILLDQSNIAYLADFGISKSTHQAEDRLKTGLLIRVMEDEEEQHQLLFATPDYSAPEHLLGRQVDARTDVFGLGLLVYELLTGRQPYGREDDPDPTQITREQYASLLFARMQNERPIRPSQFVEMPTRSIARRVDAIILRALDPEPERRYRSAGLLATALGAAGAGELIPAWLPTTSVESVECVDPVHWVLTKQS
jgi:eukaryotic-like serine/threonine-protein kinase